jgi:hypothetical protein
VIGPVILAPSEDFLNRIASLRLLDQFGDQTIADLSPSASSLS